MKLWQLTHALAAGALGATLLSGSPGWTAPAQNKAPRLLFTSAPLPFMATASPAVADVDNDGRPEIAMTVDNIGYAEPSTIDPLDDPNNPNAVYLWGWTGKALGIRPGWPKKTRDAALGLSLIDLDGDARPEVMATCSQDNRPPEGYSTFVSRLYVWNAVAQPLEPWAPWSLQAYPPGGNAVGAAAGHSYVPPVGLTGAAGGTRVLMAAQGVYGYWDGSGGPYYPKYGSLTMWSPDGAKEAQVAAGASTWAVYDGPEFSRFSGDAPPVLARRAGATDVAVATTDGVVYRWGLDGLPAPGYHPDPLAETQTDPDASGARALLRSPIAAADLDGDGDDEILAGSGVSFPAAMVNTGALYCWDAGGRLVWRYPLMGEAASFTSGIAVGRLGKRNDLCVVVGDAAGRVSALNRNGSLLWTFETAPGTPIGQYAVVAEPVIGDVNADGVQDVVVGGSNGYVYALNGRNGSLLWKVPTPLATAAAGGKPEVVYGAPVLCDLQNDGALDVVVVTGQRVYTDAWHGSGHIAVWDCGPGTYRPALLDWPQFQRDPARSGRASAG